MIFYIVYIYVIACFLYEGIFLVINRKIISEKTAELVIKKLDYYDPNIAKYVYLILNILAIFTSPLLLPISVIYDGKLTWKLTQDDFKNTDGE